MFVSIEVVPKTLDIEHVLRDHVITEAWVAVKLERRAAHATLRTMTTMLEGALGPGVLERAKLPTAVRVMRLQEHEDRREGTRGFIIKDTRDGSMEYEIHPTFKISDCLTVCFNIDRCGIGGSGLHYGMHLRLLFSVAWGVLHDGWNIVKTGCKQ